MVCQSRMALSKPNTFVLFFTKKQRSEELSYFPKVTVYPMFVSWLGFRWSESKVNVSKSSKNHGTSKTTNYIYTLKFKSSDRETN